MMNENMSFQMVMYKPNQVFCSVAPPADSLQVSRGFLPVQHPGKLFLVAGGGHVPADSARLDVRVPEEVLLVVHSDWMG